jgi:hypothetical protein
MSLLKWFLLNSHHVIVFTVKIVDCCCRPDSYRIENLTRDYQHDWRILGIIAFALHNKEYSAAVIRIK